MVHIVRINNNNGSVNIDCAVLGRFVALCPLPNIFVDPKRQHRSKHTKLMDGRETTFDKV